MAATNAGGDNSSHLGGFHGGHSSHAGLGGGTKIDADSAVQPGNNSSHAVFGGGNHIDADASVRLGGNQAGFSNSSHAGFNSANQINATPSSHFASNAGAGKIDADTSVHLGSQAGNPKPVMATPPTPVYNGNGRIDASATGRFASSNGKRLFRGNWEIDQADVKSPASRLGSQGRQAQSKSPPLFSSHAGL